MEVLFFGRKGDSLSQTCARHLNDLGLDVHEVYSTKREEVLPDYLRQCQFDYIFCYRSYFILPNWLLKTTKYHNINFHPSPPKYRGSGGVNLALLNDDENFGVTIHLMDEQLDSGPIIKFSSFPIHENDVLETLLNRAHNYMFAEFIKFTSELVSLGEQFVYDSIKQTKVEWAPTKTKISEINKLQIVDLEISEIELRQRIKSIQHKNFPLEIRLHNHRFIYDGEIS